MAPIVEMVNLAITYNGECIKFKSYPHSNLGGMFRIFKLHTQVAVAVKFFFNGLEVQDTDTFLSLTMEDGALIDCVDSL